jgi:hypothetical protein
MMNAFDVSRRGFLRSAAPAAACATAVSASKGAAATVPAEEPVVVPRVRFFGTEITRLVLGSNPLYGYSHLNPILDKLMREWMTPEHRVETLHRAEAAGINTWQVHYNDNSMEDLHRYRAEGGKMHLLLLADFALMSNWKLLPDVAKLKPLGVAHHGNRTDTHFRNGTMETVHDFVKAVHDAGMRAGVSAHNPAVFEFIERRGWPVDYYMNCLYHVTRDKQEAVRMFGETTVGEPFMERDPERMTAIIRQTRKPCFAFKLLAAGRGNRRKDDVDEAFRFALQNIKPQDAVIVGMFPKFENEMRENAERVARICSGPAEGPVPSA